MIYQKNIIIIFIFLYFTCKYWLQRQTIGGRIRGAKIKQKQKNRALQSRTFSNSRQHHRLHRLQFFPTRSRPPPCRLCHSQPFQWYISSTGSLIHIIRVLIISSSIPSLRSLNRVIFLFIYQFICFVRQKLSSVRVS